MAQSVIRIRGHLPPDVVAKLLKRTTEPSLTDVVRLFKDRYGYAGLQLEIELDLKPLTHRGTEE